MDGGIYICEHVDMNILCAIRVSCVSPVRGAILGKNR